MIKYLLDTNVISELRKPKPHGAVLAWLNRLRDDQVYLSAVSIGELQRGIEQTRKQDQAKALEIETWLNQVELSYNILPMDAACFREWARLMNGQSDHLLEDAMIAAVARVNRLEIATRNETDFARLGVQFRNPFKTE